MNILREYDENGFKLRLLKDDRNDYAYEYLDPNGEIIDSVKGYPGENGIDLDIIDLMFDDILDVLKTNEVESDVKETLRTLKMKVTTDLLDK